MTTDAMASLDSVQRTQSIVDAGSAPVDLDTVPATPPPPPEPTAADIKADLDAARESLAGLKADAAERFTDFFASDTIESIMKQQDMIEEDFDREMSIKTGDDYSNSTALSLGDILQFNTLKIADGLGDALADIRGAEMNILSLEAQLAIAQENEAQQGQDI